MSWAISPSSAGESASASSGSSGGSRRTTRRRKYRYGQRASSSSAEALCQAGRRTRRPGPGKIPSPADRAAHAARIPRTLPHGTKAATASGSVSRAPRAQGRLPRAARPLAPEGVEGRPGEAFDDGAGGGFPLLGEDRGAGEARQQVEQVPGGAPGRARRVGAQDREGDLLPHGGGGKGEEELLLRRVAPTQRQGVRQVRLPRPAVDLLPVVVREERVLLELGRHRVLVHRQDDRPVRRDAPQDDGSPRTTAPGLRIPPLSPTKSRCAERRAENPSAPALGPGHGASRSGIASRSSRIAKSASTARRSRSHSGASSRTTRKSRRRRARTALAKAACPRASARGRREERKARTSDRSRASWAALTVLLRIDILRGAAAPRRSCKPRFPIGPGNDQELLREEVPQVGSRGEPVLPSRRNDDTGTRGRRSLPDAGSRPARPRSSAGGGAREGRKRGGHRGAPPCRCRIPRRSVPSRPPFPGSPSSRRG